MVHWVYLVCYPLVKLGFILLSRYRVKGKENVPHKGPVLVVANHMTNLDGPLLSVSVGRYLRFMAKEELFNWRLAGYFMRGLGTFPVQRGRLDREALRTAEKVLAGGGALAVFPEGQRSRSHKLQHASAGAAMIALRYRVPILPVGITGTEQVSGIGSVFRRPRVTVSFGPPFYLPATGGKPDRAQCTHDIMEHIAEVLPAQYRGVYADREDG